MHGCVHAAGPRDTRPEQVKAVTYDPTADFPFRIRSIEKQWAQAHGKHAIYTYPGLSTPTAGNGASASAAPQGSRQFSSWGAAAAVSRALSFAHAGLL